MSNKFKVGDKITINYDTFIEGSWKSVCVRDCTKEETYEVISVGEGFAPNSTPDDVVFIDDVGDAVTIHTGDVILVE